MAWLRASHLVLWKILGVAAKVVYRCTYLCCEKANCAALASQWSLTQFEGSTSKTVITTSHRKRLPSAEAKMASLGAQTVLSGRNAFAMMISQMLSPQNDQRQAAEALFSEVKKNADLTATNLIGLLRQSPDVESRAFCAVMLRRVCPAFELSCSADVFTWLA